MKKIQNKTRQQNPKQLFRKSTNKLLQKQCSAFCFQVSTFPQLNTCSRELISVIFLRCSYIPSANQTNVLQPRTTQALSCVLQLTHFKSIHFQVTLYFQGRVCTIVNRKQAHHALEPSEGTKQRTTFAASMTEFNNPHNSFHSILAAIVPWFSCGAHDAFDVGVCEHSNI